MEQLQRELDRLIATLPNADAFRAGLETLVSLYPFNDYEYIIAALLAADKLTHDEYIELRDDYIKRNPFLYLFEFSPACLGKWAEKHLGELSPGLCASSSSEYDCLLDGKIKIEVKASRAVEFKCAKPIYAKALLSNSNKRFEMNFQQAKSVCCDVFLWIGVWRDVIRYWVLASREMAESHRYSAGQHRGNEGEGQLHMTHNNIQEFACYEVRSNELTDAIRKAFDRQHGK